MKNKQSKHTSLSTVLVALFFLTVLTLIFGLLFSMVSFVRTIAPLAMIPCLLAITILIFDDKKENNLDVHVINDKK
ncbi:hypothetical protein EKG37_17430 [Robertmurraya yapensis]|uniref:Uncharacterized protein n=1 Tax=Bacillus yapensis TaxID=2492960 RepID=A0A3S0I943_9BACI|nr:hypothetical protein [Bacillus yapensis]RTR28085.1 hypothetical protein EKG37_17430 [Bacillus yapensis]TKS94327.1 hypothetical protein FAR12_17430 [Bacillus yapensis]